MANTPTGPRHHETRALLRAHLAAASGYRHSTRHCPICHRLLRLAVESGPDLTTGQVAPPADRPPPKAGAVRASPEAEPGTDEVAAVAAAVAAEAAKDAIPAAGSAGK